jgi:hypothetical protein
MTTAVHRQYAKWPLFSGLVLGAAFCCTWYWPVTQIAYSILFAVWAVPYALVVLCILMASTWCGLVALLRRRWRRAASMALFPVIMLASLPAACVTDETTSWLHFVADEGRYLEEVQQAAQTGQFKLWDWGGNVMVGFNRALVWSAGDEVALPPEQQPHSWKSDFPISTYRVRQAFGEHFYIVEY